MKESILLVDDDQLLLYSMQRTLRKHYNLTIARGGVAGLAALARGEFAVVVSDLRMPDMDGIDFLAATRQRSPDSTRVMLTGYADLRTAIEAVNESHIFRLLTKPVSPEALFRALDDGIRQHHLLTAERELLSKTLVGSVKAMVEVMGKIYPPALQRATRLRAHVRQIVGRLQVPDAWQYELAAMLAPIGNLGAPVDILDKVQTGQELTRYEQQILVTHGFAGRDLLKNIPRLESIAEMIASQYREYPPQAYNSPPGERNPTVLGAQILQTAAEFERYLVRGLAAADAVKAMRSRRQYDPTLLDALLDEPEGMPVDYFAGLSLR